MSRKNCNRTVKPMFPRKSCLIIGEVAQAHDGSLGMAHAYIDSIAEAGADAVKFQTHIAAAESTAAEQWRVKFSYQDSTRYNYWKRMEFTEEQWHGLAQHARQRNLVFLSSPFSPEAVDLLLRVGIPAWKIASGEVNNAPLFDKILQTKLPILLSTGMSSLAEIDLAVEKIKQADLPLVIMQCHTAYPCPPEKVGLNMIPAFRERYGCPVGLSDHSGTIFPGLAATALGIQALEVHVTLSRQMFGPDVPASVTTSELRQLVEGVRFIEKMLANPADKNEAAVALQPLRELFTKSLFYKINLPAGSLLTRENLAIKKPGTGIPASQIETVLGRRLRKDVIIDSFVNESDLE
jgi:N,N'-diacetyllegionaminate synthase